MSQDGSSSKSYIKHPTEKARLDNLAFTSFPEDYLPYTSPSYQRKAPYLVWDHQHYDGGGGLFRSRRRRLRRCCCGTAALASAIALLIAAILAIVAVSVYLGVVTNLFRSPIFSLSGKFRIVEGDEFEESLLNHTSYEFLTKADYYKSLIENVFSSSSLAQAFIAARVYAFRPGSLLVFFRLHLDRRKMDDGDQGALLVAKQVFLEQAISAPTPSFDNLVLDMLSIDIREYDDEEWMMVPDFFMEPEEAVAFDHKKAKGDESSVNVSEPTTTSTTSSPNVPETTLKQSTSTVTVVSNRVINKHDDSTQSSRRPHRPTPGIRRIASSPAASVSKGQGVVGYGYAEWKPIELPEAIQVSSLGAVTPSMQKERVPHRSGSVSTVEDQKSVQTRNSASLGNVRKPQQSNVASSITSSVSLVIRPSSKNRTGEKTSGVVKAVVIDDEGEPPVGVKDRVDSTSVVHSQLNRKNSASFRFLELSDGADGEQESTQNETNVPITNQSVGIADLSEEVLGDSEQPNSEEVVSNERTESSTPGRIPILTRVPEVITSLEFESEDSKLGNETRHEADISWEGSISVLEDLQTQSSGIGKNDNEDGSDTSEYVSKSDDKGLVRNEAVATENETTATTFGMLLTTLQNIDTETELEEMSGSSPFESEGPEDTRDTSTPFSPIQETMVPPSKSNSTIEPEDATILSHSQYSTQETTYHILESSKQNHSSQEETTRSSEATHVFSTNSVDDARTNTSTTQHQDLLRFRKIVQPLKDSSFNPNDINSKDNFKDDSIFLRIGHTSTMRIPLPISLNVTPDSKIHVDDNVIRPVTTSHPTTVNVDVPSSESFEPVLRCLESEMTCGSGECVPLDYLCNMRRDCEDNTDEEQCTCADYLRVLGQSQKICDGIRDCWDDSDEESCPWCQPGQFPCLPSKICINASQVCDGSNDCPFGTDERYCVKLAENEARAKSLDYYSEGYLMVRKGGFWGKLCLGSELVAASTLQGRLDEIGRAVCSTLTYRAFREAAHVQDQEMSSNLYYEIKGHSAQHENQRSSAVFEPTSCPSKSVVRVKCQALECGLRPMAVSSRRRIVGGQSTNSGSWPWQVALYKEGDFQCGAVLVSDTWLISAGHCFYSTQTAHWTARLGILRRGTELPSPSEQVRRVVRIILHPEYVDKGFINDIALLRLEKPVPFSDYLRPLCLPMESEDVKLWDGQYCSVVGWGKLFEIGHTFPDSLQEVRLPVISTEECRKRIIFLSMYHITDNMFCAGYEQGGHDACLGDSGGPLMCQRQDGRWVLLGVTSNGDGCGRPGRPGVYTKVTQYLRWIEDVMNEPTPPINVTSSCLGHRCELGRCVQHYKVCDKRFDCSDGSDELNCPLSTKA